MKCVVFDLDGTLVDTAEDIRRAVNYALKAFDGSEITPDECRSYVGNGLRKALVKAVAAHGPRLRDEGELELMYELLMGYYRNHPADYSVPYDGISELLHDLVSRGIKIGILSNKRDELVKAIAALKFPDADFSFVQGQTDSIPLKPDKRAMLHALEGLSAEREDIVYVGDSEVDAEAADNAGVARVIVSYGFRSSEELSAKGISSLSHVPSYSDLENAHSEYWSKQ